MIDFINAMNMRNEINIKEIYELFKTDSVEFNSKFLSHIQKYKNMNEFFAHYSKLDFENVLNMFDCLESLPFIISDNTNKHLLKNTIDNYLNYTSKIILSFLLIEKTRKLLNNLITTTKNAINEFCNNNEKDSIYRDINNCLNIILNDSKIPIQRSLSRRGTKEKTLSSYNNAKGKRNSNCSEISVDNIKLILVDNDTPKFEEKEKSNNDSSKDKKDNSSLKESEKTIDSILSLRNMKFLSDNGENTIRGVRKKNKTIKIGFQRQDSDFFLKQKSNSNKINENPSDLGYNINTIDKSQILAELLNVINCLFDNGQINLEQKLSLKQLLISDSENVINRLFKYNETNFPFNTNLKSVFKKFLISELKKI